MRPHLNLSATQLAALSLLGNVIAAVGFLSRLTRHTPKAALGFFVVMAPVLLGLGIYSLAISQLKNDIQNNRWTDEQLAPLRRITNSPALTVAVFVCFGIFATELIPTHTHRHWGWMAYIFGMCLFQLQQATRLRARSSGQHIDWSTAPPITSDHWGQHN